MDKVRSFVAIELTEELKKEVAALIDTLKPSGCDVKWVHPKNIHLTLKFLGHIHRDKIEEIKHVLDATAGGLKSFGLRLSSIGAFPKISYPRVIWVGLKDGANETKRIYELLEQDLDPIGFQKEKRPFSPHLTIGRVRSQKNKDELKKVIEGTKFSSCNSMEVNHLTLFESTLTPKGPIYSPLYNASLK